MNEQQMLAKYQGIVQFQTTINNKQAGELIEKLMSLLHISFDKKSYEHAKGNAKDQKKPFVFYQNGLTDPRCLVLAEDWGYYSTDLIIRFHEPLETPIRELLKQETEEDDFQNCLIQQSKMNRIVKRHDLKIDIVDEFDLWNTLFQSRSFWGKYIFFEGYEVSSPAKDLIPSEDLIYPELADPIQLKITNDSGFMVWIDDQIDSSTLYLTHPSLAEPFELGWDDLAQWHPHVLRWEELEKICLFLTIQDPDHFVIPFLLLQRFAPVTKEDDEKAIACKVKAAWRSLRLFTEEEIEQFCAMIPCKPGFAWSYEPNQGWYHACKSPDDIYSMRHICTDRFPFQALEDVLQTIDRQIGTDQWKKAEEKWGTLVSTFSIEEDKLWFERKSAVKYEEEYNGRAFEINDDDLPF